MSPFSDADATNSQRSIDWPLLCLLMVLPLLMYGLYWTARNCPIGIGFKWSTVIRENERFYRIEEQYPDGDFRWPSYMTREYRLDTQAGEISFVSGSQQSGGLTNGATVLYKEVPGCDSLIARVSPDRVEALAQDIGIHSEPLDQGVELVVLMDAERRELARWQIKPEQRLECSRGHAVSLSSDSTHVLVRNATTGSIVTQIPIEPASVGKVEWNVYDSVVRIEYSPTVRNCFHLQTGRKLPTDGSWLGVIVDMLGDEYLTIREFDLRTLPVDWRLQLRAVETGRVVREYKYPPACGPQSPPDDSIRFSLAGDQIVFVSHRDVVFFFDKLSGRMKRKVDPHRFHYLWTAITGLLAISWGITWMWLSTKRGWNLLFRSSVLTCLVTYFLVLRNALSGHFLNYERPAWQSILALLLVWWMGLVAHSCAKHSAFLKRLQMPIAFGFTVYLVAIYLTPDSYPQSRFILAIGCYGAVGVLVLWFAKPASERCGGRAKAFTFSIADTIRLMTFATVLFAAVAQANPGVLNYMNFERVMNSLVECVCLILATVLALYAVQNRQRPSYMKLLVLAIECFAIFGAWGFYVQREYSYAPLEYWDLSRGAVTMSWAMLSAVCYTAFGFWRAHHQLERRHS